MWRGGKELGEVGRGTKTGKMKGIGHDGERAFLTKIINAAARTTRGWELTIATGQKERNPKRKERREEKEEEIGKRKQMGGKKKKKAGENS